MVEDKALLVSADQALTATAASTDVIDFGSDRDVGVGGQKFLVVTSKAAPGGTSPTITISLEADDNSSFSSAATLITHPVIAGASFASGTRVAVPIPFTNERYLRAKYTLGGTSPTFTVDAVVTNQHPPVHAAYPDAALV